MIVTVFDDRVGLEELLPALAAQTRAPDELVVVDAGSTDGSLELLDRAAATSGFPIRVLAAPGAGISAGRNRAIEAAAHDWVACTDAGCRPFGGWLEAIDAARPGADFVAGVYVVEGANDFERAQAVAIYPDPDELDEPGAMVRVWQRLFGKRLDANRATGRSMAFRKEVWEAIGGFPEHLATGEDTFFSLQASVLGFRVVLARHAVVGWRPRPTWRSNARMFFRYSRGDVRLGSPARHLARLGAWVGGPLLALAGGPVGRGAALLGGLAYLALPLQRARRRGLPVSGWWRVPALIALKDLSQLAGAAAGLADGARGPATDPAPSPVTTTPRRAG